MIEQKLYEVREFIEDNRRGDNPKPTYWILHFSNTMPTAKNSGTQADKNFEVAEMDASIELLNRAIARLANQGHKYITVSLRSAQNDGHPSFFIIDNPVKNAVGSMGMYPGAGNGAIGAMELIGLMQMQSTQQIAAMQEQSRLQMEQMRAEFKHKNEVEKLKDEIDALKNTKSETFLEKIIGNPMIQNMVSNWIGGAAYEDDEEEETPQHHTDENQKKALEQQQQQFKSDLDKIKEVFPNLPKFMSLLANYVQKNPEQAKQMFQIMQNG